MSTPTATPQPGGPDGRTAAIDLDELPVVGADEWTPLMSEIGQAERTTSASEMVSKTPIRSATAPSNWLSSRRLIVLLALALAVAAWWLWPTSLDDLAQGAANAENKGRQSSATDIGGCAAEAERYAKTLCGKTPGCLGEVASEYARGCLARLPEVVSDCRAPIGQAVCQDEVNCQAIAGKLLDQCQAWQQHIAATAPPPAVSQPDAAQAPPDANRPATSLSTPSVASRQPSEPSVVFSQPGANADDRVAVDSQPVRSFTPDEIRANEDNKALWQRYKDYHNNLPKPQPVKAYLTRQGKSN